MSVKNPSSIQMLEKSGMVGEKMKRQQTALTDAGTHASVCPATREKMASTPLITPWSTKK